VIRRADHRLLRLDRLVLEVLGAQPLVDDRHRLADALGLHDPLLRLALLDLDLRLLPLQTCVAAIFSATASATSFGTGCCRPRR